ncbi:hypothetical protein AB0D04_18785 [Streptomyces sp. NPDC048483]|uniref:hypothetical protein n=1 Tax=Streptomyces sp. NPDC048483 TaxID=3154927 RepID=UPI00342ADFD7
MGAPQHNGHKRLSAKEVSLLIEGGELGASKRAGARGATPVFIEPEKLQKEIELHVCMGLNSCKGHGVNGTGDMAGMGECATVFHVCHGDNECRGQGGCGYSGSDAEQAKPGNQECRWNGSCASPVNEGRVHAAGPYRGTSVWKRARKIFEERMYTAGRPFGPSPGEGFPDNLVPPYEEKRKIPHVPKGSGV